MWLILSWPARRRSRWTGRQASPIRRPHNPGRRPPVRRTTITLDTTILLGAGFTVFIVGALALDLGVFHRKAHVVDAREALSWTVVWETLAVLIGIGV